MGSDPWSSYIDTLCYQTRKTSVVLKMEVLTPASHSYFSAYPLIRPEEFLNPTSISTHETTQNTFQDLKIKIILIKPLIEYRKILQKFDIFPWHILYILSKFITFRMLLSYFCMAVLAHSVSASLFLHLCLRKNKPFWIKFSSSSHFPWLTYSYDSGQLVCHLLRRTFQDQYI